MAETPVAGGGGPLAADPVALAELLDETQDIITVVGSDRRQKWVSGALHRVLGYRTPPERFPADFVHPDDQSRIIAAFDELVGRPGGETCIEYRVRHADGSWRWIEVTARNRIGHPRIDGVVATSRDITVRKEQEEQLRFLASHDWLTGLPNRSALEQCLERQLETVGDGRIVVFFVDADGFKAVNDTLGHPAGDEVLRVIAERLAACVPDRETVARYGGDEFVVLARLPEGDGAESAFAGQLRTAVLAPITVAGATVHVDVSVGWATGAAGANASRLIKDADDAAYAAKRQRQAQPPASSPA